MLLFSKKKLNKYNLVELFNSVENKVEEIQSIYQDKSFNRFNKSLPLVVEMKNKVILKFSLPKEVVFKRDVFSDEALNYLTDNIPLFAKRKTLVAEVFTETFPNTEFNYLRQNYENDEFELEISIPEHNYPINFSLVNGNITSVTTSEKQYDLQVNKEARPNLPLTKENLEKSLKAILPTIKISN